MLCDDAKEIINLLSDREKVVVLHYFRKLLLHFLPSAGLEEPHFLFLDNSILQDVKNRDFEEVRKLRFVSECLFFEFVTHKSGLHSKIALPPVILYEFGGKKLLENESEYKRLIGEAIKNIGIFNMEVHSIGYSSYEDAKKIFINIRHDEREIIKAIKKIKSNDWHVPLRDGYKVKIPFSVARKMLPNSIKLKYFNKGYVKWLLSSLIEREILTNKNNDPYVRKNFRHDFVFDLASLYKIEKEVLKGIGDIELFQFCDITAQFQKGYNSTYTAITFDEKLRNTLLRRTTLPVSHEPIVFGKDSKDDVHRKFSQLNAGRELLNTIGERQGSVQKRAADYYEDIRKYFT